MAREFDVQVKGLAEIDRMLGELPASVGRRVQTFALKKAAAPIEEAARSLAPRRTGVLAASIKTVVKRGATAARATVRIGLEAPGRFYGHFLEFGTRPRGNHPGTARRPFMTPAFERLKEQAIDIYTREVMAAIQRAVARSRAKFRRGRG